MLEIRRGWRGWIGQSHSARGGAIAGLNGSGIAAWLSLAAELVRKIRGLQLAAAAVAIVVKLQNGAYEPNAAALFAALRSLGTQGVGVQLHSSRTKDAGHGG